LTPCDYLSAHPSAQVAVDAWFIPTDHPSTTIDKRITWNTKTDKHFVYDIDLPPGFYHYAVVAVFGPKTAAHVLCDLQLYAAVLPDKVNTIADTMEDGVSDPITPVLLAGTLQPGMTAWLVRYDGTPACGQSTLSLIRHQLLLSEVQDGAYYGYDTTLTGKPSNGGVVFGLELGWPDDERRVVRLVGSYPSQVVSGIAKTVRFDVTPDVARELRNDPPLTLACPST